MIPQYEPLFDDKELRAVYEYMGSDNWLTEHKVTTKLENMLYDYLDVKHCVMMPNGTLALYAALMALRVGFCDWVIVPGFTMIATANAVTMANAFPCFTDIEAETLCLDVAEIEKQAKRRPGRVAVIYVSINGRCGDIEAVRKVCLKVFCFCIIILFLS